MAFLQITNHALYGPDTTKSGDRTGTIPSPPRSIRTRYHPTWRPHGHHAITIAPYTDQTRHIWRPHGHHAITTTPYTDQTPPNLATARAPYHHHRALYGPDTTQPGDRTGIMPSPPRPIRTRHHPIWRPHEHHTITTTTTLYADPDQSSPPDDRSGVQACFLSL